MLQTVRVRLRKPQRVLIFLARDITLERNDPCIVRTDWGLEYGIVIAEPEDCGGDAAKRYPMPVVRKATTADRESLIALAAEEKEAAQLCMQRIRERNLPMQVVDAEYTFDRHKVVVNFTADDRVDFRELVRDLAQDLKARIELRHIQVRDKSKIVGGLAGCGRELCCATWLSAFLPISMKMAKRQNLSLNPTKISGQCGRLMCCLSYENEMYESPRKKKCTGCPAEKTEQEGEIEEEVLLALEDQPDRVSAKPSEKPVSKSVPPSAPRPVPVPQPVPVLTDEPEDEEDGEEDVDDMDGSENAASGNPTREEDGSTKRKRSRRRRRRRKPGSPANTGSGQPSAEN